MGISCCKNLLILSIFLTLLSLNINNASAEKGRLDNSKTADLIKEICPKTRNSSYCFYLLGFQENATVPELGQASVRGAVTSVILAEDVANVNMIHAKSPEQKRIFRACYGSFLQAGEDVAAVGELMKSGPRSYKNLPVQAAAVVTEAGACDKLFRPPIPPQPEDLKIMSQDFQDRCSIVLVISKLLAGEKLYG